MNDDISEMRQFVEVHQEFLIPLWEWIMSRAEVHDIETLDLFTAWITVTLKQSSQLMRQDIKALRNGQVH